MATVTLACATCNKEFIKTIGEYNRRIKLGKDKFYCSLSCASKTFNNIKHLKKIKSDYPIWKHADNKKDKYSKFKSLLRCARQRNKQFNLTLEYLEEVWQLQNGKCPFTGFDLELRNYDKNDNKLNIKSASLDRIDNSKGYIIGNIRFVSVMFNYARNKFTDQEVLDFAQAIIRTMGAK